MALENLINDDIKKAMLAKDKGTLDALRAIKSEILLLKTGKQAEGGITEQMEIACLQKLVKQRKESAEIFEKEGRTDLADAERAQSAIIERYLPKQLDEAEILAQLKDLVAQAGATSAKDMGKVMGLAVKHFAGKADNKTVSTLLKQILQ